MTKLILSAQGTFKLGLHLLLILIVGRILKSKPQWDTTKHLVEWMKESKEERKWKEGRKEEKGKVEKRKKPTRPCVGENVEELLVGMQNGVAILEKFDNVFS